MKVNITLDKKWFEANKAKFAHSFDNDSFREPEDKGKAYVFEFECKNNEIVINDRMGIKFSGAPKEGDWNYCFIEDDLDTQSLLNLAQAASKHYNRVKAAFESLQ
jgi:hypothetical protein